MIKRFFLALAFAGMLSPAYGAGTIPLSMTQRLDKSTYKPLNGGKLYFYAAGTTTPQNAFIDSALTIAYPNPITLDAGGNVPQLFFADGQIKFRLTNSAGVDQLSADNVLVIGASSGGGGGGSVDPTTVIGTGDVKVRYGTGVLTGFVRANGRTIGSATSGATERANSDAQALFEYLWGADSTLTVSTGRGASANADWVANKTIALPDGRGRALVSLDDMGNSAASQFTNVSFTSGNATTLGSRYGLSTRNLAQNQLPNATLSFSNSSSSVSVTSTQGNVVYGAALGLFGSGGGGSLIALISGTGNVGNITSTGTASVSGNTSSINGGVGQSYMDYTTPSILITTYIKL